MKTPRASFVIPAYDAQKYLAQTLLSCREQTIKDIEIIVVDDGSSDGTAELVQWHMEQDHRIVLASLDENKGRSAARNFGNSVAKAPIILVLDADDMACKNRVRDTLAAFEFKRPDVIYGPFQFVDEFGNILDKAPAGPFNKDFAIKQKMNFIGHSTMAYRKGVTLNVQYDEGDYSRLGLDDWKFQWDCYLRGYKFAFTKTVLSQYRVFRNEQGIVQTNTISRRDENEVSKLKDAYISRIQEKLVAAR